MTEDESHAGAARQAHLEDTARRLDALPLRWQDKVEIWQEETSLSETSLASILKQCGEFVPE